MTMAPSVDSLRPFALNAVNSNPIPNPPAGASLALGLSVSAWPLLQQLQRSGHTDRVGLTPVAASALETPVSDMVVATASELLAEQWRNGAATIVVGALGAVTRLIAPLLSDKQKDPAVIVLDAHGQHIVPLIGGHTAGAEQLAHELAASLGGEVVLTGDAASQQRLALDAFGEAWGWVRGGTAKAWHELMLTQAAGRNLDGGNTDVFFQGLRDVGKGAPVIDTGHEFVVESARPAIRDQHQNSAMGFPVAGEIPFLGPAAGG